VCEKHSRKFGTFGIVSRKDAQCFHCGALERHRFVWLFFSRMTNLFDGTARKVLHVAPEPCFVSRLEKRVGNGYLTADLTDARAMVCMDITKIDYPDEYFDIIYCSHVLEHVEDDRKAMREFHRVLKPGGWAIVLVPIEVEKTFEDSTITDPADRLRMFGQDDHVRIYGLDFVDRLREAGFTVRVSRVSDLFDSDAAILMGLTTASGEIYCCSKA
jgi:predicted SAM-dependent methyltransferase